MFQNWTTAPTRHTPAHIRPVERDFGNLAFIGTLLVAMSCAGTSLGLFVLSCFFDTLWKEGSGYSQ